MIDTKIIDLFCFINSTNHFKSLFENESSENGSDNGRTVADGHRVAEVDELDAKVGGENGERADETASEQPSSGADGTEQRLTIEVGERETEHELGAELDRGHLRGVERLAQFDEKDREGERDRGEQGQKDRVEFGQALSVHAEMMSYAIATRHRLIACGCCIQWNCLVHFRVLMRVMLILLLLLLLLLGGVGLLWLLRRTHRS